jgi:hypothetical protein
MAGIFIGSGTGLRRSVFATSFRPNGQLGWKYFIQIDRLFELNTFTRAPTIKAIAIKTISASRFQ